MTASSTFLTYLYECYMGLSASESPALLSNRSSTRDATGYAVWYTLSLAFCIIIPSGSIRGH